MLKVLANLLLVASVTPVRMRYDQSQIGDYNVHLDLKNIEIVAFLDDSSLANNEVSSFFFFKLKSTEISRCKFVFQKHQKFVHL